MKLLLYDKHKDLCDDLVYVQHLAMSFQVASASLNMRMGVMALDMSEQKFNFTGLLVFFPHNILIKRKEEEEP